jgi:hypothetical protein
MEINLEALSALSVADLSGLITLQMLHPSVLKLSKAQMEHLTDMLKLRMDDVFIN